MEVSFENDRSPKSPEATRTTTQGQRRSVPEQHSAARSEWLFPTESDSTNIYRRLDLPLGDPLDDPHSSPALSVYGHCAPMPAAFPRKVEASREFSESRPLGSDYAPSNQERLLRLMEAQQAWYDLHQQAAAQAAEMLNLVEHHQSQWIR